MKKSYFLLFATCLIFMAFQCEDDSKPTMEDEQKTLIVGKKIIEKAKTI